MKFDDILTILGGFGKYQKRRYFVLCIPCMTAAFHALVTVFIVALPDHRCALPGLENDTFAVQSEAHRWLINQTIPPGDNDDVYSRCKFYVRPTNGSWAAPENRTERECDRWVFDKSDFETTSTEDMNLVCDDLVYRSHLNSLFQGGIMVGSLTLGTLADVVGRKKIMCISLIGSFVVGMLTVWVPEYASFMASRFLLGALGAGYFLQAFTMGIELVAPSKRMWTGMIIEVFWAVGEAILALMAYFIRDWRYLQLAISVPSVFYLAYWWLIPESPRWLLANGKVDEAEKILRKAAEVNKTTLPDHVFDKLEDDNTPKVRIFEIFVHRTLLIRSLIIFLNWCVVSMVYYGLSLNSGYLYGGVHLNFFLSVVVELIGYALCFPLLDRIGRKACHASAMLVGGISCCCTIFTVLYLSDEYQPVTTALALLGKLGASAAFAIIYIYSSELFPTVMRNSGMGFSSTSARVGSIASPYIADLGQLVPGNFGVALPLLVFGLASVAAGIASLWLPETLNRKLPETIEDAINFGKQEKMVPNKQREKVLGISAKKLDYDNPAMEMDAAF